MNPGHLWPFPSHLSPFSSDILPIPVDLWSFPRDMMPVNRHCLPWSLTFNPFLVGVGSFLVTALPFSRNLSPFSSDIWAFPINFWPFPMVFSLVNSHCLPGVIWCNPNCVSRRTLRNNTSYRYFTERWGESVTPLSRTSSNCWTADSNQRQELNENKFGKIPSVLLISPYSIFPRRLK